MKPDDFSRFVTALKSITDLYKDLPVSTFKIYWDVLKDYELEQVYFALKQFVSDPEKAKFMPKPGDLLLYLKGDPEALALDGWAKVTDNLRSIGSYDSICFDDGIIHAVIRDLGGWIWLCQVSADELPFIKNEFIKRYVHAARISLSAWPTHLPGIIEQQNGKAQIRTAYGCNGAKAKQVYLKGNHKYRREENLAVNLGDLLPSLAKQIAGNATVPEED